MTSIRELLNHVELRGVMPFTTASIIALVAGSSVLAAIVTQCVTWIRDWRKNKIDGSFAALYLAIALEAYASQCASALGESETYDASEGHGGRPHGNVPDMPDFPESIEWKPFGITDTTKAMSHRVEIGSTQAMVKDCWEFDEPEDVVPIIQLEMARLGRKALDLAVEFRSTWKIVPVDYTGEWNVSTYLTEKLNDHVTRQQHRLEQKRKMTEELSRHAEANFEIAAGG